MVHLLGDSFRLWWRNLLPMTTWFLAGYVGFKLSMSSAIWLAEHSHSSIGVGVFSAGVLMQIAAYVGMIRTCATSLYRWRDAASNWAEETSDPTQQSLMELLAVTLLPLVAVWSAWGYLEGQVSQLTVSNLVQRGLQPGSGFFDRGAAPGTSTCRRSSSCWCCAGCSRRSTTVGRAGRRSSRRCGPRRSSC